MRYTKYNHKKRVNNQFSKLVASILLTGVVASATGYGLGKVIFNVIPKGNLSAALNDSKLSDESKVDTPVNSNNVVNTSFALIQCGYFSKKENAEQALNKLNGVNTAFINEEEGKFRVIAGIYETNSAQKAIDELKSKGVESMKVEATFNPKDEIQSQLAGISDGYLLLLNEANATDVKQIDTKELKKWVTELKEVKDGDGVELLNALKQYIIALPDQINKEDISKEVNYLYDIIIKYSKN